jgi:lipoprotein-anchoring transpeptidase ErfK/SrfK
VAGLAVVVVIGVGAAAAGAFDSGSPHVSAGAARGHASAAPSAPTSLPARTATTTPHKADRSKAVARARLPKTGWVATLRRSISYSDRSGGPAVGRLAWKNPYGQVDVLGVVGVPETDGWAEVELPVRPDGTTAWIQTRAVTLTRTPWWIHVDLTTHELTVGDGRRIVVRADAAIGSPSTPTPTGRTYVWESLRPSDPTGAYGPYILGLGLYSQALATFNGGPAQIAIHGTDAPGSVGQAVSNGCVRVPDTLVTKLVRIIPLGTPVTIVG